MSGRIRAAFLLAAGDARAKWPATALTDPRVRHRWDETRALGRQYLASVPAIMDRRAAETLPPTADAMWDAFFLYAPGDSWQDPLPLPVAWGYPIMVTRGHLARQLDALVARRGDESLGDGLKTVPYRIDGHAIPTSSFRNPTRYFQAR